MTVTTQISGQLMAVGFKEGQRVHISDIDGYKAIVVAYLNAAPVHLSDVANVIIAPENTKLAAWANATPSLILNIQRQPGANVVQVADAVKALLPKVVADMPPALEISVLSDRTQTLDAQRKGGLAPREAIYQACLLRLEDGRAGLASANANSPKGAVEEGDPRFQLYTNDQARAALIFARSSSPIATAMPCSCPMWPTWRIQCRICATRAVRTASHRCW